MVFNLNEFLIAVSFVLDFVEMDIFGVVTNHSKRVAYISMMIAKKLGLSDEEIFDIVSLAILHDNGASEKILSDRLEDGHRSHMISIESKREHGIKGEENIKQYPFLTDVNNVIKYHHENYDGTGFFGIKGTEIPIMSQIIRLADMVELNAPLKDMRLEEKQNIRAYVKLQENSVFSPKVVETFIEVSNMPYFWLDLKDTFIHSSLIKHIPNFSREMSLNNIRNITEVFSKIIDSKSRFTQLHSKQLSEKIATMGEFYNKPEDEIYKLVIAADLHDIGKLAVSNSILDKPGTLTDREFDIIKEHPYYTRLSLQEIKGFEDITEWASNHHEKLNGRGYPYEKTRRVLDFNSRLLACLDVYQALTEERPYRESLSHKSATEILSKAVEGGALDMEISRDIIKVFKS